MGLAQQPRNSAVFMILHQELWCPTALDYTMEAVQKEVYMTGYEMIGCGMATISYQTFCDFALKGELDTSVKVQKIKRQSPPCFSILKNGHFL